MGNLPSIEGIKFASSFLDQSGYGSHARDVLKMLRKRNFPVETRIISFETDRPDLGEEGNVIQALSNTNIKTDVMIARLTPDMAVRFIEPDKVNINWFSWECTGLHPMWLECLNRFDGVFTDCEWTKQELIKSGVIRPIFTIPINVDFENFLPKQSANMNDTFKFYSIFQWQERKNPVALLKSYYRAFDDKDNVLLVLKTYVTRMENNFNNREVITNIIGQVKQSMQFNRAFPNVYLITDKLVGSEITQMHNECDSYVSLSRGEGWDIPAFSSMIAGNSSIVSNHSSYLDYTNSDISMLVDGQMEPTFNLSPYYPGNICTFFNADVLQASEHMRYLYENRIEAFTRGQKAREHVVNNFNEEKIFNRFIRALGEVIKLKRG